MMITFPVDKISEMFSSDRGYLYDKILKTVLDHGMEKMIEDGVLLGFSGGADSVMLLCFLYEYKRRSGKLFDIVACHINHMIRGSEAVRDQNFAKKVCDLLNIPFLSFNIDVPKLAKSLGIGIEEAARNARYSKFKELTKGRKDLFAIAVAHNATDNVETVLFNMMRGCGLSGACGILPVRDNIIRPLIRLSKEEILSYLNKFSIPYVTDSSNLKNDYTRNYIRHEIVPKLYRLSNSPEIMITRFTDSVKRDNDYLSEESRRLYSEILKDGKIKVDLFRKMHPAMAYRLISAFIKEHTGASPESKHIDLVFHAMKSSDNISLSLPGGFSFIIEHKICSIVSLKTIQKDDSVFFITAGLNKIGNYKSIFYVGESYSPEMVDGFKSAEETMIVSKAVSGKMYIRFRKDGDSYRYGGITHKLKKVFNDRGIPPSERDRIPILCDDLGIVWVPGLPPRDSVNTDKKDVYLTLFLSDGSDSDKKLYTARQR